MKTSTPLLFTLLVLLSPVCVAAEPSPAPAAATPAPKDNDEVAALYVEDQADRQPPAGKSIDWKIVQPRDQARQKRVMELYAAGELKTGKDYYHAGMILQHGDKPEDYLLCHELCVAAVFKAGRSERASWLPSARWLAAASEDRFLLSIGRAQRFGTQFSGEGENPHWTLDKMESGVTDELRKAWSVPTLAQAKEREAEMNAKKE